MVDNPCSASMRWVMHPMNIALLQLYGWGPSNHSSCTFIYRVAGGISLPVTIHWGWVCYFLQWVGRSWRGCSAVPLLRYRDHNHTQVSERASSWNDLLPQGDALSLFPYDWRHSFAPFTSYTLVRNKFTPPDGQGCFIVRPGVGHVSGYLDARSLTQAEAFTQASSRGSPTYTCWLSPRRLHSLWRSARSAYRYYKDLRYIDRHLQDLPSWYPCMFWPYTGSKASRGFEEGRAWRQCLWFWRQNQHSSLPISARRTSQSSNRCLGCRSEARQDSRIQGIPTAGQCCAAAHIKYWLCFNVSLLACSPNKSRLPELNHAF